LGGVSPWSSTSAADPATITGSSPSTSANIRTIHVPVGNAHHKTWWRNFLPAQPLRLHLTGHCYDATAMPCMKMTT